MLRASLSRELLTGHNQRPELELVCYQWADGWRPSHMLGGVTSRFFFARISTRVNASLTHISISVTHISIFLARFSLVLVT